MPNSLDNRLWEGYRHPCPKQHFWAPGVGDVLYHMGLDEQVLFVDNTGNQSATVMLPDVGAAKGKIYAVSVLVDAANNITLIDESSVNAEDWSDLVFTAVNDGALVMSDGIRWHILVEITT